MKKQFYLLIFSLIGYAATAQTPGGVTGSVLWLKANDGGGISAWLDKSGTGNDFTQAVPANQPSLALNVYNFNAGLQFDGLNSFMANALPTGFPASAAPRTIIVVANANPDPAPNYYRWILAYGNVGFFSQTCQVGNHTGSLANDFYANDEETANFWDNSANSKGALASFTLDALSNGIQYDRGNFLQTKSFSFLSAPSANAVIGAVSTAPAELWSGSIGEVIMFDAALSDADRTKVESYLALKYGFTLGSTTNLINYTASDGTTVYWQSSATYQNDVFGIGTDNGTGLIQTQSNSINSGSGDGTGGNGLGNIVLSTATPLADKQFLLIGNNADDLFEHIIAPGETAPIAVGSQRINRNWQVQNTNAVGAVNLSFDTTGLTLAGGSTLSNFRLMVDADGDGDFSTGTTYIAASSATGNKINFTGVTLPNNAIFSLITQTSALLPAIMQDFTVTLQKNRATLNWKTSSEVNVDHYTAEYSLDGNTFLAFGTVAALNGAGINEYTLTQGNVTAGIRYYRIRRVDKDGRFQFSIIRLVKAGGLTSVTLKANPVATTAAELIIDVPQNQNAVIRVISTSGKILSQQNAGLSTGINNISTRTAQLAAGTYFIQVQLNNEIVNKKFVKL